MDRELLLEIGVEELPAGWLPGLTRQLSEKLSLRLADVRLTPDVTVESYATPRRLTARVGRMPERQEDLDETISGPPVSAAFTAAGEPTPAAVGFARKQGVAVESLDRVKTDKGEYLAARRHVRGRSTVDVLPELLGLLLRDLAFPKQMHWDALLEDGKGELVFGRPIRWLLYLYGGRVVPFTIGRTANAIGAQVQEVTSGAVTYGHRFLATSGRAGRAVKVRSFDEYRAKLPEHFVVLDHAERRDRIARELESKARKLAGRVPLRDHAALVDEVADLVEYPGVVAGFYERNFLELPQEVLTTTLVHHQHYFPVVDERGALKEAFLAVVNTQPSDERLIARNAERVVTARLRDARFFWESDRRTKLEDRLERLHSLTFHKKLQASSYRDKAERIEKLAGAIATEMFSAPQHAQHAATAARLAKADLVTDMVFEFPELQGVMGGIYAREEGLPEEVWKAIYYHYLPLSVEADASPTLAQLGAAATTWAAVALADKLDTLVGLMLAGEKASGSRDPFGLRRQAAGIVRIAASLDEFGIAPAVNVGDLIDKAALAFGVSPTDWQTTSPIDYFVSERLRHLFSSRGFDDAEINAEAPLGFSGDPHRAYMLLKALHSMRGSAQFAALAVAFKRAANIVSGVRPSPYSLIENHEGFPAIPGSEAVEAELFTRVRELRSRLIQNVKTQSFRQSFVDAAELRPLIDDFFDKVMVMHEDERLRANRLGLLQDFVHVITEHLGDISQIVPSA